MLDAPSMARLKQLIKKYKKPRSSFDVDTRPVSGMVGQKCEGFIQNENGGLIRIAYEKNNDEQIGPGSYDPIYQSDKNIHSIRIQDKHNLQSKPDRTPSPGKYIPSYPNTRILHSIAYSSMPHTHQSKYEGEGPVITHPSWVPNHLTGATAKKNIKKLRLSHPSYQFRSDLSTFQFSSNTRRNIFPKQFISPSPVLHAKQRPPVEFDPNFNSPVFADKTDRFKTSNLDTPSPAAYNISDTFGKAPTKILTPQSQISKNDKDINKLSDGCFINQSNYIKISDKNHPYQPSPDPAMYAGPVIQTIDASHHSPQFEDKIERFKILTSDTPSPTLYNTDKNANIAPQHKIRNRSSLPTDSWCTSSDSPPVGSYNPKFERLPVKSGYISSIGRRSLDIKEDHPLAFRTMHSSLLKKSYNANYMNVDYNY